MFGVADLLQAKNKKLQSELKAADAEIKRRGECMEKLFHTYGTGTIYVNAFDWFDSDGKVKPYSPEMKE